MKQRANDRWASAWDRWIALSLRREGLTQRAPQFKSQGKRDAVYSWAWEARETWPQPAIDNYIDLKGKKDESEYWHSKAPI